MANLWTDLVDFPTSHFAAGEFRWYETEEPYDATVLRSLFAHGEPNNGASRWGTGSTESHDCVSLFVSSSELQYTYPEEDGKWNDLQCSQSFAFETGYICQRATRGRQKGIVIGDMLVEVDLTSDDALDDVGAQLADAASKETLYWPNGLVPIKFVPGFSPAEMSRLQNTFKLLERAIGCKGLHFEQWNGTQENYVSLEPYDMPTRCASDTVGMHGGRQRVILGRRCFRLVGTLLHEMLHVLGFAHEHQRPDRDAFIDVKLDNVLPCTVDFVFVFKCKISHIGSKVCPSCQLFR